MLKINAVFRANATLATHYYADLEDDYYAKEGASCWQGKGALALGLDGEVDAKQFNALLQGRISPQAAMPRSARHDSKARAGWDFTFSAPKSVSLQALVGGDAALITAHDKAVAAVIDEVEKLARARLKEQGKSRQVRTRNLIVAKFRHETARPTADSLPDPELHTHAVVMNMTQRGDGKWRSVVNDVFFQMRSYLDAVYMSELARESTQLGYSVRHDKNGNFELGHISREQIEAFSKRSQQLIAALEARGLSRATASNQQKQAIILAQRQNKPMDVTREQLHGDWQRQAKEIGLDFQARGKAAEITPREQDHSQEGPRAHAADTALRWAIQHMTERESIMLSSEMKRHAIVHAGGVLRGPDIDRAVDRYLERGRLIAGAPTYHSASGDPSAPAHTREAWIEQLLASGKRTPEDAAALVDEGIVVGRLVLGEQRYTTQVALEREKHILRMEAAARGQVTSMMEPQAVKPRLQAATLNAGQLSAAELMLSTTNRVIGLQGYAGTGKSHMLKAVTQVIAEQGYNVKTVASYGTQVRALRELGVESNTIASMLTATSRGRFILDEKTVLMVDEAGVVPARLMEKLLHAAEKAGARVVLLGDIAQTKAIEAGRPFEQLQKAGMATAVMDEIQRQRDPALKRAVELAAAGLGPESLKQITSIVEIPSAEMRHAAVAKNYSQLSEADRRETLIVTGTNASRREINDMVRLELGTAGEGQTYQLLTRRDTTQAERRQARYYVDNDMIQPERNYKCGLVRGELYTIVERATNGNRLTVEDSQGRRLTFDPSRTQRISVYEPITAEVAAGDWIRITRNDADRDLTNGNRYQVVSATADALTIDAGGRHAVLPGNAPIHLDLAYATTIHSAQGLTSDRVIINADSRSRTTKEDVYYVAISRARQVADIYTDSRMKLPEAISRDANQSAALDLPLSPGTPAAQHQKRELEMNT